MWRSGRAVAVGAVLAVSVSACAPQGASEEGGSAAAPSTPDAGGSASTAPSTSVRQSDPADEELSGVLGGDAELEGGCAWIDTDRGRLQPVLPAGYSIAFDPLRLETADGTVVAEEGERVTVVGHLDPSLMTTCQVGRVLVVSEVATP